MHVPLWEPSTRWRHAFQMRPYTWAPWKTGSWRGGLARPAEASCGHITAPQSPRVWHTVPTVGHPEFCPTAKAAWRTGCSQSGTSEQELGVGGGCSETWRGVCVRSEVRLGPLPALRSPQRGVGGALGCRDGQRLRGIHRHWGHLNSVELMDQNTQLWALNTLVKSPNQSRAELPK